MTTSTYTATDIVNFAASKDGVSLSTAFDQLIGQRVVDAIDARKQEIAATMFNDPDMDDEQEDWSDEAGEVNQPEQSETEESDEESQSTD